jgi:hypothetical protein
MYGLSIDGEEASVVLKTSDVEKAEIVFNNNGVAMLSCDDIKNL